MAYKQLSHRFLLRTLTQRRTKTFSRKISLVGVEVVKVLRTDNPLEHD